MNNSLYERLKRICREKNITPTVLCTKITGSPGNLATWKKGNIRTDYLIKIADYFGLSVDYLLGRETNTENNLSNSAIGNKNFIENIEQLCQKKNISVSKMTADLKLAIGIVDNWKQRGTFPSDEVILDIANYLGVTTDYLLNNDNRTIENEIVTTYMQLDDIDRAEVRGVIRQMLKADKYKSPSDKDICLAPQTKLSDYAELAADGGTETRGRKKKKVEILE